MKHIADLTVRISQVGDQLVAEVGPTNSFLVGLHTDPLKATALLSAHLSANAAMTEEGARYFAIKNFCLEIGDELRAVLERMEIALT